MDHMRMYILSRWICVDNLVGKVLTSSQSYVRLGVSNESKNKTIEKKKEKLKKKPTWPQPVSECILFVKIYRSETRGKVFPYKKCISKRVRRIEGQKDRRKDTAVYKRLLALKRIEPQGKNHILVDHCF